MPASLEVLLVEDNEGDVEMTQTAFREDIPSCNLSVANDGMDAMDFLHKRGKFANVAASPNIILLDLNMPRMDGKKFLETIKEDDKLKAIPVIMLTSSQSPTDIRECYERHASCYVVKPFGDKEFSDTLKDVIGFWSNLGRLP